MKTEQKINIDAVWEQFFQTHDEQSRNTLMEHYRSLVKYCAERLHTKLPDKVELDDLISAGTFGLMDAIDAFDKSRGVKFETYCSPRIRGSILDELRSMDWVPRLVRARAHQLSRATHSLEVHLGRKPTDKELAEELQMNMDEFTRLQKDANAVSLVSLTTNYSDDDGDKDVREIDIIKDRAQFESRSRSPEARPQRSSHKRTHTRRKTDYRPVLLRRNDNEGNRSYFGFIRIESFANALVNHRPLKSPDEYTKKGILS